MNRISAVVGLSSFLVLGAVGCSSSGPGRNLIGTQTTGGDGQLGEDVKAALAALGDVQVTAVGAPGVPSYVVGRMALVGVGPEVTENALREPLAKIAPAFRLQAQNLSLVSLEADELGFTHARYRQSKNGLDVVGGDLAVHVNAHGHIYAINGTAHDGETLAPTPAMTATHAADLAVWSVAGPVTATEAPRLVYVIAPADYAIHLAYAVHVQGHENSGLPLDSHVYVDALDGSIASVSPHIQTALTRKLYDGNHTNENFPSLPGTLKRSEGGAASGDSAVDGNYDSLGNVYNYYKTVFSRDSWDGTGGGLTSTVHVGNKYNNAYWNGSQMVYGDGDGTQFGQFATALDVTGHELTHGVTGSTANLNYQGESGAINEAMSDIQGESIEAFAQGQGAANFYNDNTFLVGEEVYTPGNGNADALRYMLDPTKDQYSADYYPERLTGSSDNGGVHGNSGIANLAWALLVKGGGHPRNKTTYVVPAIGIDKARAIFYRADTKLLTSSANFQALRTATAQAANDLGYGPDVVAAVQTAWDCVAVPGGTTPPPPPADAGTTAVDAGTPPVDAGTPPPPADAGTPAPDGGTPPPPPPPGTTGLTNGVPLSGQSGALNGHAFYAITVPAGATKLVVTISGSTSASNDADLYLKFGAQPSLTSYDCRPYRTGSNESCTVAAPKAGNYYVMLNGYSAYSGVTLKGSFTAK